MLCLSVTIESNMVSQMHSTSVAHEICIALAGGLSTQPLNIVEVYVTTSAFVASEAAWYVLGWNRLKKSGCVTTLNQLMLSNEQTPTTNIWKQLPDTRYIYQHNCCSIWEIDFFNWWQICPWCCKQSFCVLSWHENMASCCEVTLLFLWLYACHHTK